MELVENLSCHADSINCIALLTKGNRAISASTDKCIKLWDLSSQKLLASQELAHNSAITHVFLTNDNNNLVSASSNGCVKLWKISSQSLDYVTELFPEGSLQHISFSPTKELIVTASKEGSFYLWKLLEQKTELINEGSLKENLSMIFLTKDGNKLVFGGADEATVHIRNVANLKECAILKYPESKIDPFDKFSNQTGALRKISDVDDDLQSKRLAIGFTDGSVEVWSLDNYTPLLKFQEKQKGFDLRIAFCALNRLAMSTKDRMVKIMNLETQECELKYDKIHKDPITHIAVQSEAGILSTCSKDRTFRTFSFQTKSYIATFHNPHERAVNAVVFSPQGNSFVTCSADTTIKSWSLHNCQQLHKIKNAHENSVSTIAVSDNGKYLASSSPDKSIKLWSFEKFKLEYTWSSAHSQYVNRILITPDSEKILSASTDNTIKIWSIADKNLVHTFNQLAHAIDDVISMAITPDGEYVISGSSNKSIKIFSLTTYQQYHTFEDPNLYMTGALAVTKDSSKLVSASFDRAIRLWDLKSKQLAALIEKAHADVVNSLVILEKYGVVASGGSDHHIKFWDLITYKLLHTINQAHTYPVKDLAVSPNNTFLVSVSSDKSIKVWNVSVLGVWIKGTSQKEEIVKLIKVKSWESLDEIQYERYKKLKETLMKQIKIIENMTNEYRNKIYFANKIAKVTASMDTGLTAGDYLKSNECRIEREDTKKLVILDQQTGHCQNFVLTVEQFVNAEESIDTFFLDFLRNLKGYVSKEEESNNDDRDEDGEVEEKTKFRENLKELEQHCDHLSSMLKNFMAQKEKSYDYLTESRITLLEEFSNLSKQMDQLIVEGPTSSSPLHRAKVLQNPKNSLKALISTVRHTTSKFTSTLQLLSQNEETCGNIEAKILEGFEKAATAKQEIYTIKSEIKYSEEELSILKELKFVQVLSQIDMKLIHEKTKRITELEENHKAHLRKILEDNQVLLDLKKKSTNLNSILAQEELFLIKVLSKLFEKKKSQVKELLSCEDVFDLKSLYEVASNLDKQIKGLNEEFMHRIKKQAEANLESLDRLM